MKVPIPPAAIAVPLEPGDLMPPVNLPALAGGTVELFADHIAGNSIVLALSGRGESGRALLEGVAARHEDFIAAGAHVFGIGAREAGEALPFPYLLDRDGKTAKAVHLPPERALLIVLGANAHALYVGGDVATALAVVRAHQAARTPVAMGAHPPVLIVPGLLGPADIAFLANVYETRGKTFVTPGDGIKGQTSDYKMRIPEYGRGDRIDHYVLDRDVNALLDRRLERRLYPEIRKAFQYRITGRENYRIAAYEGSRGGELHGHRDNTAPHVAHRRFAVSINLNTEAFEGGELRYPEYGQQRYRPASGDAICFSCSILHEAMAVTAGRRLVVLAFLAGDT